MRRVVLDANVLVSGIISPGICRSIIRSLEEDKFVMVLSPPLLEDFLRALEKPKVKRLTTPAILEEIIALIHKKAFIVEPKVKFKVCRDPSDDAVLECAVAAGAEIIATGDKDLLTVKSFRGIAVLSPRTFASGLKIK